MSDRPPRSLAEWVSLVASSAIVLLVVALIAAQIPGHDQPAAPVARVERVREVGETFHVDVTVHNDGDRTAAEVQVVADLTIGDETFTGDQTIDFLSGGEDHHLVFLFPHDPDSGQLRTAVTAFAVP